MLETSSSKIQLMSPLRKENISIDNSGGRNWSEHSTIEQVSAEDVAREDAVREDAPRVSFPFSSSPPLFQLIFSFVEILNF
jgi:hypothetical protein